MERLTYDFAIGNNHCWEVHGADNFMCKEVCVNQGDSGCEGCPIAKAIDRLAAYENTKLAPEDIERFKKNYEMAIDQYAAYAALGTVEEAKELFFAKEGGRLIFTPYRVGDTVYVYSDGEVKEETVKQIFIDDRGAFLNTLGHFCGSVNSFSNFGKTVFPTREAAEAALKEQEENG